MPFWKRRSKLTTTTAVWKTEEGWYADLIADIVTAVKQKDLTVVVTHFPETHDRIAQSLEDRSISVTLVSDASDLREYLRYASTPEPVAMIPSLVLELAAPFERSRTTPQHDACVLVPEIHPTPAPDKLVEQFAAALPYNTALTFYSHLDSPFMQVFGSERIQSLMGLLGLTDYQRLEHPHITRSIRTAQKRLASSAIRTSAARSMAEWMEKNLPRG